MIAEDPGRPRGRVLLDADGREIARFEETERDDRRVAGLFMLHVAPELALPIVLAELAGWRVSADEPFARMLVAVGGRPRRHGHTLSRDLARDPAPPDWLEPPVPAGMRLTPVDRPALDLAPACLAAYPREQPDFDHIPTPETPEVELEEIISGRMMGPLLPCSGLAVGEDGAVLVNATDGEPPTGGPWVSQFFRHPDARGIGAPLLRRARARHERRPAGARPRRDARQHGAGAVRGARVRRGPELAHGRALKARGAPLARGPRSPGLFHVRCCRAARRRRARRGAIALRRRARRARRWRSTSSSAVMSLSPVMTRRPTSARSSSGRSTSPAVCSRSASGASARRNDAFR